MKKKLRAIDLYSGIGGWSLGLKMAGIQVVNSFEWWDRANLTNKNNNQHNTSEVDIRNLNLKTLPKNIDVVVGSPPCTQFSFSNKGGKGDINDGLKDIYKFFEVVEYLKPKYWAMENVPRVAKILEKEFQEKGQLHRFTFLNPKIFIVDASEYGVPQKRQRAIIGNFDSDLFLSYKNYTQRLTLGNVIDALGNDVIVDPIYRLRVSKNKLTENDFEENLSDEEMRMNKDMKCFHPIYNNMAFPDNLKKPSRTITATCTRISRESVIVKTLNTKNKYRRLSVRERGMIQSFPINYEFYGNSHSQKLKMIGNAIPPLLTFYIAQSFLGISPKKLIQPNKGIENFIAPVEVLIKTKPDKPSKNFPLKRRFRAAIPNLRFKSGVRFELTNSFKNETPLWDVDFYFGNSKNINKVNFDNRMSKYLIKKITNKKCKTTIKSITQDLKMYLGCTNANSLQSNWNRTSISPITPYEIVDKLGEYSNAIATLIHDEEDIELILDEILSEYQLLVGIKKLRKNASAVLSGLIVSDIVNTLFRNKKFNPV